MLKYFLIFPRKQVLTFHTSKIFIKYQSLFSRKNKITIINLSSVELAQRVVKVNAINFIFSFKWDIHH